MIKYLFHLSFSTRLFWAIVTSLVLTFYLCRRIIFFCNKNKIVDEVRDLQLEHQENKNVPSMGGVAIVLSTFVSTLLFANLKNIYVQLLLLTMLITGGIGFVDDYIKIFKRSKEGIRPIGKLLIQGVLGIIICCATFGNKKVDVKFPKKYKIVSVQENEKHVKRVVTRIPFCKKYALDYKTKHWLAFVIYVCILTFIISGTSNAVNLTDGIDGLALKNSLISLFVLIFLSFVFGKKGFASNLHSFYIKNILESSIFSCSLFSSCLACLWFNAFPAKIFIGDTGSLMLGGVIAVLAIFLRIELFLPILCGLFFIETLTVILQVGYFKYTKKKSGTGKKLFLLSPLHYHLIKKGWPEVNTAARLTILSIVCAIITLFALF